MLLTLQDTHINHGMRIKLHRSIDLDCPSAQTEGNSPPPPPVQNFLHVRHSIKVKQHQLYHLRMHY